MKTLLLMRHAKSSWKDPELADHERPLNKRGKKDAPFMGEMLKEKELLPQKLLASTAMRVRQTVEGLAQGSGFSGEVDYLDLFYLAEPESYLTGLRGLGPEIERVMIVGHNPGLEGLLQQLSGRIETLPTGTLAFITLPIQSWDELNGQVEGELVELINPHELRELETEDKKDDKKHKVEKKDEKKAEKKDEKKAEKKEEKKEEKKSEKKDEKKHKK